MIRVLSVMGLYLSHALPVDLFRPYARSPKGHDLGKGHVSERRKKNISTKKNSNKETIQRILNGENI
jgi:hypothetical protein